MRLNLILPLVGENIIKNVTSPLDINPGDVVNIPASVKHCHGEAKNSWFSHISVGRTFNRMSESCAGKSYEKLD